MSFRAKTLNITIKFEEAVSAHIGNIISCRKIYRHYENSYFWMIYMMTMLIVSAGFNDHYKRELI